MTLLTAFTLGACMYCISPVSFIRNPLLWLATISRVKAHITAAPNFAYQLCVDKFKRQALPKDFSVASMRGWGNAAEPIRRDTLEKFSRLLSPYGFDEKTWLPCYGLAENVVRVCSQMEVTFSPIDDQCVSCGTDFEVDLRIVDPSTRQECPDGVKGEIWVSCTSKPDGYWGQPALSIETFFAHLACDDDKPQSERLLFTRTGDKGYIIDGHLYFAGRIKDMIIIRGGACCELLAVMQGDACSLMVTLTVKRLRREFLSPRH